MTRQACRNINLPMEPANIAAFAIFTGLTSLVPGPQVLYTMTQSVWRGPRRGLAALAGLQPGNAMWFVLAGLGLGTLATSVPVAFKLIALALAAVVVTRVVWAGD